MLAVSDPRQYKTGSGTRHTSEVHASPRHGKRAFRRPATDADVDRIMGFFDAGRAEGGKFDYGIEAAVQRILADPEFIYRSEIEPAATTSTSDDQPRPLKNTPAIGGSFSRSEYGWPWNGTYSANTPPLLPAFEPQ